MKRIVHNPEEEDCFITDIGLCIQAESEYDFSAWDLDMVLKSNDLFQAIEDKKLFLEIEEEIVIETGDEAKECFTPVTQFCTQPVRVNQLQSENLSQVEEFILANLLHIVFKTHAEALLMREHLKNVIVFLGKEYWILDFYENVMLSSGSCSLAPRGDLIELSSHSNGTSDITTWGSIHEVNYAEEDEHLIITLQEGCIGETSIVFREPDNNRWSSIDYVTCEFETVVGLEVFFVVNGDTIPGSSIELKDGKTSVYFDLSGISRNFVRSYGIGIKLLQDADPCELRVSKLMGFQFDGIYEQGRIELKTFDLSTNMKEIFVYNNWTISEPLSLVMDISLDGGENWKRINHGMFNSWVSVADWEMNAEDKLKIRYIWDIRGTGLTYSPVLNDFFVMYRV